DADPFHLFPLVEAEMWLRAAAVYKPRAALSEAIATRGRRAAEKLISEMEAHEEREGRDPAALSRSPLAELWEEGEEGEEGDSDSDAEQPTALAEHTGGGGERGLASEWWAGAREARLRPMAPPLPSAEPRALDLGCVSPQAELQAWRAAARRAAALAANVAADERAAAAAAMRREEEEREASRRRKE
ncbi:hypothetical protein EMIHUDRAFT_125540, partial [Emiliania huxleyi CCMP1516]|uniref:Uncharacterized protein n=2 Tax=Emiliania huxleyi TaxID=2903 RepID=A0A0D3KXH5_EMIH1